MRPATQLALAYVYATGRTPAHIRLNTYLELRGLIESRDGSALYERPKPDALADARSHPLGMAHDYLTGLGFTVDHGVRRKTSRWVGYHHRDFPAEAMAYREGGGCIIQVNDSRPYRMTLSIPAETIAEGRPALAF